MIPLLLLALTLIFSCSRSSPSATNGEVLRIAVDGHEAIVLIADDDASRERGLMFRENLGEADGMLFVYEEHQVANFWMKNTPLPLTLAYIDKESVIFQIEYLEPYDTVTPHWSTGEIAYALELKRGWLRKRGLGVGSKLDLRELEK